MLEAAAAKAAGHDVALVALAEPGGPGGRWPAWRRAAVYGGWMLDGGRYAASA
jgi:hypothetical protein